MVLTWSATGNNIANKVYNFIYCSESSQLISYMYTYLDLFAVYSRILADAILTGSMDMLLQWLPTNFTTKVVLQVLMWLAARFAEW